MQSIRQHNHFGTILVLVFTILSIQTNAQNNENIFTLKPVFGGNGCQIHGDNASGYRKFGFNAGLVVNSKLNSKSSLDIGFIFNQKGARKNQNPDKGDYTFFRVNLNYVEIPVLFNYKLNKTYFLTLGPSVAYLINYTEDTEAGNWNGVYPFNNLEYSINVGLGRQVYENWHLEIRSGNSFLPIREYGIAATKVFYPNAIARFFNQGLYNNVLSFILIYQIKLKKSNEPIQE